jgi:hypothetical protein
VGGIDSATGMLHNPGITFTVVARNHPTSSLWTTCTWYQPQSSVRANTITGVSAGKTRNTSCAWSGPSRRFTGLKVCMITSVVAVEVGKALGVQVFLDAVAVRNSCACAVRDTL